MATQDPHPARGADRREDGRAAAAELHALSRLHGLALLQADGTELQPLLREVLDTAIDISDSDFGELQLSDPADAGLHMAARLGTPPAPNGAPPALQETPLVTQGGKPIGLLSTHRRAPGPLDGAALKWLELLARQAADMIDGARTRTELSAQRQRLEALLQALPVGVAFADTPDCRHVTGNVALRRMFDAADNDELSASADADDAAGRQIEFFAAGRPVEATDLPLQRAGREGRRIGPVALEARLADGRSLDFDVTAAPLLGAGGEVRGAVAVLVDTVERRRADEALEQVRLKDEFLAVLSHELRNPLAAIAAAADGAPPGEAVECLALIRRQLQVLARLTEDLADAARIAGGQLQLNLEPVSLRELLRAARDVALPAARLRGQRLVVTAPAGELSFLGDRVRLLQILMNLLDNAAKYGRDGGLIELRGELEGDELVLRCRDDGQGIEPHLLQSIFEPLVRAPAAKLAAPTGLGLGLTLIQRLVQLHGGSVTARSAGAGRGSEFVVRLPWVPASPPAGPAPAPDAAALAAAPLAVLLVEDHPEVAAATAALLRAEGLRVAVAGTGCDAIEVARRQQPRLLLCDINLPDMSGLQLVDALRERLRAWNTHVVVLSARTRAELGVYARRAAEHGVHEFIAKPLGLQQLRELLQGLRT